MNKIKFLLASMAAFLSLTGVASAMPVITNGDFQTPQVPVDGYGQYLGGSAGITGWTVTGADVLVLNTTYSEPGLVFNAQTGTQSLDLTGAGNTGSADGVFQSVTTEAGKKYAVSFFVGRADDGGASGNYNTAAVVGFSTDGGSSRDLFENSLVTANGVNWKAVTAYFVATGTSTDIGFFNSTVGNNFAGLSGVSIQAVPEPASVALFGIGAVVVGAGTYRRRRKQAAAC